MSSQNFNIVKIHVFVIHVYFIGKFVGNESEMEIFEDLTNVPTKFIGSYQNCLDCNESSGMVRLVYRHWLIDGLYCRGVKFFDRKFNLRAK